MTRQCTHKRKGIVSNQDLSHFDRTRPLASRAVCDRPDCIAAGISWAAGQTNEPATYYPDAPPPSLFAPDQNGHGA